MKKENEEETTCGMRCSSCAARNESCCSCSMCRKWPGHHDGGCVMLRWVVGLFILIGVFLLGVKVGEFKARVSDQVWSFQSEADYGPGYMMRRIYLNDGSTGRGMMRQAPPPSPESQGTTSTQGER